MKTVSQTYNMNYHFKYFQTRTISGHAPGKKKNAFNSQSGKRVN